MSTYLIIIFLASIGGLLIGWYACLIHMIRKSSDGTCIRADDGEVYLQISEMGQRKLADPETRLLYLFVMDDPTRNNHAL